MNNLINEKHDKGRITQQFNLEHVDLERIGQVLE